MSVYSVAEIALVPYYLKKQTNKTDGKRIFRRFYSPIAAFFAAWMPRFKEAIRINEGV